MIAIAPLFICLHVEAQVDVSKSMSWAIQGFPEVEDSSSKGEQRRLEEIARQLTFNLSDIYGQVAADSKQAAESIQSLRVLFDFRWKITSDDRETIQCVGPSGLFDPSDSLIQKSGKEIELKLPLIIRTKRCLLDQARYNQVYPLTLLGHEAFHALHFISRPGEPTWLSEGLAQYFESMMMRKMAPNASLYLHPSHIRAAEKEPGTSLLESGVDQVDDSRPASNLHTLKASVYGHQLLFTAFWVNRCGGPRAFWKAALGDHPLRGIEGLEKALAQIPEAPGFCQKFPDLFTMFQIARYHQQLDRAAGRDFRFFKSGSEKLGRLHLTDRLGKDQPRWSAIPVWVSHSQLGTDGKVDPVYLEHYQRLVFTSTSFPYRVTDKVNLEFPLEKYEAVLLTYEKDNSLVMSALRFE